MQFQLIAALALGTVLFLDPRTPSAPAAPAPTTSSALVGTTLDVVCPSATYKVFCGEATDPSAAGEPQVSGGCPPYTITHTDTVVTPPMCPAERFDTFIERIWHVSDQCGNAAICRQEIHLLKNVVKLDLHPRSCPNPFNRGANGKYPAAILGGPNLDVTQIIPSSLRLYVFQCAGGGSIAPIPAMTHVEDVSRPYTGGDECGCTTQGPDGFPDLTFKFDRPAMEQALGLGAYPNMSNVKLVIVGETLNGCSFLGLDCVRVQ